LDIMTSAALATAERMITQQEKGAQA